MEGRHRVHPLAPLFWSQIGLAYGLPVILALAYRWRGGDTPGRVTLAFLLIYPFVMVGIACVTLAVDALRIYGCVDRWRRWLPSVAIGSIYAAAAFVGMSLARSGAQNARIAWADYVVDGSTRGMLVLLLALVIEIFATLFLVCHVVALLRRWRRLSRPPTPQAAE